ncbi:cytochrome c/c1 heme-lyase [Echria macrotheca]|uniref:Holocytochrome c-type synthase n=1 Tax=Echria macrotheca TaxID=438768 RepID=A0AAJ0BKX1_9PEZI|nr:cytochrome c/c1 heme-lyase [Echria macrotheca]
MHTDLLDTVLVSAKDSPTAAAPPPHPPPAAAMKDATPAPAGDEAKCPVDHKTRETWLQQARAAPQQPPTAPAQQPPSQTSSSSSSSTSTSSSWSSWLRLPFTSQTSTPQPQPTTKTLPPNHPPLDEHRVISSIPRSPTSSDPTTCPVNANAESPPGTTPETSSSGNWIYPSEKMFFDAMRRKGFDSHSAADMKTVVPIHNAVNERAWAEILRWEQPYATAQCGGPKLHSFAGQSTRMSPKARVNTLLGYTAPFDRHDWVVDRCGTQVEYVIDFYAGRSDGKGAGKLNFYLDVRPKLNSWEGIKMRALRATGLA